MLDEAQNETLVAVDQEINKTAATHMTFTDLVTAFPVAVPLLAAMASGGVAYAALNKTFPVVKNPKSKYPKRIRQVASDGSVEDLSEEDMPEEDMPKAASLRELHAERDLEAAANEFLMLMTDQMAVEKRASISLTSDLLNRAAATGIEAMTATYMDGGIPALIESVKGASAHPATLPEKVLAAVVLHKSARLGPVVASIAAAEFQDLAPGIYGMGVSHGHEFMDKMAGVGSVLQLALLRPQMLDKAAMANNALVAALQQQMPAELLDNMEGSLTSDAAGSLSESTEGDDGAETPTSDDVVVEGSEEDPVDQFMEMDGKSPLMAEMNQPSQGLPM